MKFLLIILGICFSMSVFAKYGEVNKQNLIGHWSCNTSFKAGDLEVLEISKLFFQENGNSSQVGTGYYKNPTEEAKLEYNIVSSWSLNDKTLKLYNAKIIDHSFNNSAFDKKYQITANLLINIEKEHDFFIENLTENVLVFFPKGHSSAEVCHKL